MRFALCLFAALIGMPPLAQAQTPTLLETRTLDEIQDLANSLNVPGGILPLDHAVAKYRVTYTMDYLGEPHEVSGALFVPVDGAGDAVECAMPTHTYMHGTIFRRVDAPSYNGFANALS